MAFKYTCEMQDFIRKNAYGRQWSELAGLFNAEFGTDKTPRQIQSQAHDIGVRNGIQAINPHYARYRPVGSTRLDKDGYVVVKVADPCTWRRAQLVEWEKHHAPIDIRKEMLIFLDGNRQNYHIDNLYKIPRKYISTINKYGLWKFITPATITTILAIVLLSLQRWETEKEKYGGYQEACNAQMCYRYHNIIKKDPQLLEQWRKRHREYSRKNREKQRQMNNNKQGVKK